MSELNTFLGNSELGYIAFPNMASFKSMCTQKSYELWYYDYIPFDQKDLVLLEFPAFFVKNKNTWVLTTKDKFITTIDLNISVLEKQIPILKNMIELIS